MTATVEVKEPYLLQEEFENPSPYWEPFLNYWRLNEASGNAVDLWGAADNYSYIMGATGERANMDHPFGNTDLLSTSAMTVMGWIKPSGAIDANTVLAGKYNSDSKGYKFTGGASGVR